MMKERKSIYLIVLYIFLATYVFGQSIGKTEHFRKKLEIINVNRAGAFKNKDINSIIQYFDANAICMPEYYQSLYNKEDIKQYYQQWLDSTTVHRFDKKIFDLQKISDYLIEIGTYTKIFSTVKGSPLSYKGKYLNVWKINNDNLELVSEMWGANNQISYSYFSFVKISPTGEVPEPKIENKTVKEVNARNRLITQLVSKREGVRHATEIFANDAIYLTYDNPMYVGMENIKPYFTEHEKPGDVDIKRLDIKSSKIIDLGQYVIEYSYYNGEAAWKGGQGVFNGKSTNIWKRNKEGKLMMYRQMVNH